MSAANETRAARKTMTAAQLAWCLKRGYAWPDPGNPADDEPTNGLSEVYWTRRGGYQWNVDLQRYEMVF